MQDWREAAGRILPTNTHQTLFQSFKSQKAFKKWVENRQVFIYLVHFSGSLCCTMLRLTWNLDTEELSRNLGRKRPKESYPPKSKQSNSWPIFIQLLSISHFPVFKNLLFSQTIFQSTMFYRIIALLYSSLKGIQCTSPALGITRIDNNPKITTLSLFHPKSQEIIPIQNSKYQGPAALQI